MAETREYNGFTYQRNAPGEPWRKVGQAQIRTAPADPTTPYKGPAAAADLRGKDLGNEITARTARATEIKANADAETATTNAALAKVNLAKAKAPPMDPARRSELQDRLVGLRNFANSLNQLDALYKKNLKGRPTSRLFGLTEFNPLSPGNAEFNKTAKQMGPYVMSALGLNGKATDAAAEYKQKVQPFIPSAGDYDNVNERNLSQLRDMLNNAQADTYRQLGMPLPKKTSRVGGKPQRVIDFNDLPE